MMERFVGMMVAEVEHELEMMGVDYDCVMVGDELDHMELVYDGQLVGLYFDEHDRCEEVDCESADMGDDE